MDEAHAHSPLPCSPWRGLLLIPWAVVLGLAVFEMVRAASLDGAIIAGALAAMFALLQLQARLSNRALRKGLRDLELRLQSATYLNEFKMVPNRNYLVDQLGREMPVARKFGEPFTLVVLSIDDLPGIIERRGEAYAQLVTVSLTRLIERFTRVSDFAAQLDDGSYCVLLYDCSEKLAKSYLRRVPGTLPVSTGKQMLEVSLTVRVTEYDLRATDAAEVLRRAEEAAPARPAAELRLGAEAA